MERSSRVRFVTESSVQKSMGVQINKDPFNTCLLENEPCLSPTLVTARLCKLLVRISTKQDLATKIQTKTLIAIIQPNESVTNRHLVLSTKCRQTN